MLLSFAIEQNFDQAAKRETGKGAAELGNAAESTGLAGQSFTEDRLKRTIGCLEK
jgi:hypothetical protein